MAAKSDIQKWLDSKKRDYGQGVKLYAEHPTAMRGLVNTLQRKQNAYTEQKLVYVLEKAAEHDASGQSEAVKKKGKGSAKKKSQPSGKKKNSPKPVTTKPGAKVQGPPPPPPADEEE